MKKIHFALVALMAILLPYTHAQTITPQLDLTFNGTGMRALDLFPFFDPLDAIVQADGKILCAGYGPDPQNTNLDGYIFRLNADGSLDESFAGEGFLTIDLDGASDAIYSLAVLPDNKILVLLESTFRTILIRLNPDGSYDTDFGNDGILFVPTDSYEFCTRILLQADGKILIIAEQTLPSGIVFGTVRRCTPDGQLDLSYGTAGRTKIIIDLSISFEPSGATLQSDGKLLITGYFGTGAGSGFPVIRLNTDGSFDNSFSSDGIVLKALGSSNGTAQAECISVGNDGKIYVGGAAPAATEVPMTIVSLNSNGGTNGSFGTFGVAKIPFGTYATAQKLIIQPDGKLLAGGYVFASQTTTKFAFARLKQNGTPDLSFGTQLGQFVSSINAPYDVQVMRDLELLPDGRLLGMAWLNETINLGQPGNDPTCYVLRYLTDILVKAKEPSLVFQSPEVFPNPISDAGATLRYTLAQAAKVSLHLYGANGQEIATIQTAETRSAGEQHMHFNLPAGLAAGTYFLVLSDGANQKALEIFRN